MARPLYLVLGSIGGSAECKGHALGEFWRLEKEVGGKAAFRQTDTEGGETFLFSSAGRWWVGPALGAPESRCWLRCPAKGTSEPPASGWSFYCRCNSEGGFWRDDATLEVRPGRLVPCREVSVAATGEAALRLSGCLGIFLPTERWSQGRPIYQRGQGADQHLLLVGDSKTVWSIRSEVNSPFSFLLSGRATLSPGQMEAAGSDRFGVARWRWRGNGGWEQGDVAVTALAGNLDVSSLDCSQDGRRTDLVKQRKLWQWWQVWW